MPSSDTPIRKLAAIMFTDIAGFTKLSSVDDSKAANLLKTQRDLLQPIVEKHSGNWLKEIGDGLLITFSGATSALECAIEIQKAIEDIEDLNLRIGIHQGEVIEQDGDIIGDDVNVASRIEPFSAVGGIVVSNKIQADISSNPKFTTKFIGQPKFKGVSQEVKVYCITSHGLPETKLSDVSAKLEKKTNWFRYAVSAVAVVALFVYLLIPKDKEVPSIAILPLDNKGAEEDEFYAYGISSDLIADITSAGLIRVAGLKDIEKLDYKNLSYDELAKKLLVRYIGLGTIWKKDSIFQLSMELYDTKTEQVTWTESWHKNWDKLTTIKDELADNILDRLQVESKVNIPKFAVNTEAYEYYLKGRYKHEKRENMEDTEIARGLLQKAIELDENLIKAKTYLGWTYYETGDYDKAMGIYERALKQAEELGDKHGMGISLNNIGNVHADKGDDEKALDYYKRSLAIQEEIGDKRGMGSSLNNIGIVYSDKGDYEKALDYYKRSLAIKEELGDKRGMGSSLGNIGNVHAVKGDDEKALDYYKRSLAILEELGDKRGMGSILGNIGGIVHYSKGDLDKALDYYGRALVIEEEIGDKRGMGSILGNIGGIVHYSKGDLDKALDYYGRALVIEEELGDKRGMGSSLYSIGSVHADKGDLDKALDYYGRALVIDEELGDKAGMGYSLNNIGSVHADKGDYKKAEEYLDKSLSIQKEIGLGGELPLWTTTFLYLSYKHLGKEYNVEEIHTLIKDAENIEFDLNLRLYELLEDKSYLETAYNQVKETADAMEDKFAKKFLSYPIPKAIVEEWENLQIDSSG